MSDDPGVPAMPRTVIKLILFLGLSIAWIAGNAYWQDYRYLRRDWLLLTVIQERVQHKTEAGYAFLFGAGLSVIGLAGLICRKRREA